MFYTIFFIDLTEEPIPDFLMEELLSADACSRFKKKNGKYLSEINVRYIESSIFRTSRWALIAVDMRASLDGNVGAFALARFDDQDRQGIYIDVTCNTTRATVRRPITSDDISMIKGLPIDKLVRMLNTYNETFDWKSLSYLGPEVLHKEVVKMMKSKGSFLYPASFRVAQLLKLTMYMFAQSEYDIAHVYNTAITPSVAVFHSQNDMTLRLTSCDRPDPIADRFSSLNLVDRLKYIEALEKEGALPTIEGDVVYPMKLCNFHYELRELMYDITAHTVKTVQEILNAGFTPDMILAGEVAPKHKILRRSLLDNSSLKPKRKPKLPAWFADKSVKPGRFRDAVKALKAMNTK